MNDQTPADHRPHRRLSETGPEKTITTTDGRRILLRQVGHHGQTGAFYALDEKPSLTERGGWGALWALVDDEPVYEPEQPSRWRRALAVARAILGSPS
jgi:hypothetical protein